MNISSSPATLAYANVVTEPRIALPDSREFASGLTIGQIIKGRVLLQYEGNRYLVAFDGRERIVDSSVPLETGDILHGRVIATGDRVELQRLPEERGQESPSLPGKAQEGAEGVTRRDAPTELEAFFARYQATLPPDGRELLTRLMRANPDRDFVILAALTLSKLGLPQNEVLLQAVTAALKKIPSAQSNASSDRAASLSTGTDLTVKLRELIQQALSSPSESADISPSANSRIGVDVSDSAQRESMNNGKEGMTAGHLGSSILNAQSGASVAHRIGTLPLIVNDRLVEVDVAVFEHERQGSSHSDMRHRALVFVLNLKNLGLVEVSAKVVDDRLRIRIGAENAGSAAWIAGHAADLRDALTVAGWSVDEVTYETLGRRTSNSAVRSVIEHVIVQDSVNRLV